MSSFVQNWNCSKCKNKNAFYEDFKDKTGYIFECNNCKYMEVYREDTSTGKIID
jgi:predicted nucleic-acid-binding Zn-ribbon protein